MKISYFLSLLVLAFPFSGNARTVLYTSHDFEPQNHDETIDVVYLDDADRLQDTWFQQQGIELSEANAPQIITLLQSPEWQSHEEELKRAYQGVISAWQLGVERVPAVVVDDRWVVYGLTDVSRARGEILQFRQQSGEIQ